MRDQQQSEDGFTLVEVILTIAIVGILVSIVQTHLIGFVGKGYTETEDVELKHLQTAVAAMMVDAKTNELAGSAEKVDTFFEISQIHAISHDGTIYTLDNYLRGGNYPLSNAYDIAPNGTVTIH